MQSIRQVMGSTWLNGSKSEEEEYEDTVEDQTSKASSESEAMEDAEDDEEEEDAADELPSETEVTQAAAAAPTPAVDAGNEAEGEDEEEEDEEEEEEEKAPEPAQPAQPPRSPVMMSTVAQALQALNIMQNGSLSTSMKVLDGVSPEKFPEYVNGIVKQQAAPPEQPAVDWIIKTLVPVVKDLQEGAQEQKQAEAQAEAAAAAAATAASAAAAAAAPAAGAAHHSFGETKDLHTPDGAAHHGAHGPEGAAAAAVAALTPNAPPSVPPTGVTGLPARPTLLTAKEAAAAAAPQLVASGASASGGSIASVINAATARTQNVSVSNAAATFRAATVARQAAAAQPAAAPTEPASTGNKELDKTVQKLNEIRVKLLRLAKRLGQGPRTQVIAQVLYRLDLAEQLKAGRSPGRPNAAAVYDRANTEAANAEANEDPLDFECTILMLGKSGVGKSSTINSIFKDMNFVQESEMTNGTGEVRQISGSVFGVPLHIIDTPGLLPCAADQRYNARVMAETRRFMKKRKPDIVLYLDRLDVPARDMGDVPLLRIVTETFGSAVWFNAIVVLTHAATAPPDGANGQQVSYDMYVAQRTHVVQQLIRQAAGDTRLMNPVSLADNHPACRTNRNGERVLPNGQVWRPMVLLLCFASKILTDANALLNLQEGRPFGGAKQQAPPLPFLLSSLLNVRKPRKPPSAEELAMQEEENAAAAAEDDETAPPQSKVAIPAPDPALPPSFDSDNPSHRYRFLESGNQWMVRPVVEAHGWDHESGIEGFSVEKAFLARGKVPASVSGQIAKDKKEMQLTMEAEGSMRHTDALVTTSGFDIQSVGRQMAYTARTETRWKNHSKNKTACGMSASYVGGATSLGAKVENRLKIKPGMKMVLSGGVITSKGDKAVGANLEATHAMSPHDESGEGMRTTIGTSFMKWKGDVALGANLTNALVVAKSTQLTTRANLNSRGSGQFTVRATSNEHLGLSSFGAIPLICILLGRMGYME